MIKYIYNQNNKEDNNMKNIKGKFTTAKVFTEKGLYMLIVKNENGQIEEKFMIK